MYTEIAKKCVIEKYKKGCFKGEGREAFRDQGQNRIIHVYKNYTIPLTCGFGRCRMQLSKADTRKQRHTNLDRKLP